MEENKVVETKTETSSKPAKKAVDNGAFANAGSFFKGVKAEFGKIIWPTREDIIKQTTAVVVVSAITCALIAGLDVAFETGMNFITTIFK